MWRPLTSRYGYLPSLWGAGAIALALATWLCLQFQINSTTAAFVYLIAIVLLSLLDSFVSSIFFSVIAVACLDFFFVEPRYSFQVQDSRDLATLAAFVITSLAITSLVRRVRRLGDAQQEQIRLLDLTTDSVFVRDIKDAITYWNRGAEALYGWKRDEVVGKVSHQVLQTIFPAPLEQITEVLTTVGRWEGELVHKTRDGTQVRVASRWSLQRNEEGVPIGTLESNTDITERKRAEDSLQRAQATYLAEAQQLSHTGSFGWNLASGELFWSEESFRIFGYDPATKPTLEMVVNRVHPDDVAIAQQAIERAATEQQEFDLEHRLQMPDGSVKHLHVVAHPGKDAAGNLQFMGAMMDITAYKSAELERGRAQDRLQKVQAEFAHAARISVLGELAASIAHEVNQPLASLTTGGEAALRWLDRAEPNVPKARDLMRHIIDDARRAADIIARLQAMAAGRAPQQTTISLNDVIEDSMVFLGHELQSKSIAVSLDLAPALPLVTGDRIQLQQVVVNLAINAAQAIAQSQPARGIVSIQTKLSDSETLCCILEDSGPGISLGQLDHLFESFFTTKDAGMGMGLSICRSIIEAHGGAIQADNNSTLGGARFRFTLPVAGAQQA
jgi:PAS domain S-box-containing protein